MPSSNLFLIIGSLISARTLSSSKCLCIRTNFPFLATSPPHSAVGVFCQRAILLRISAICASLISRSAWSTFLASWKHWYGICSKGTLSDPLSAARRRREPTGWRPRVRKSLRSCRGVLTISGSRYWDGGAGGGGGGAALIVDSMVASSCLNAVVLKLWDEGRGPGPK